MSWLQWDKTYQVAFVEILRAKKKWIFVKHNQQLCIDINSEAGAVYREENNFCSSGRVHFENCFTCMGQFVNVTAGGK